MELYVTYKIEPEFCFSQIQTAVGYVDEFDEAYGLLGREVLDAETAVDTTNPLCSGLGSSVSSVLELIFGSYVGAWQNSVSILGNAKEAVDAFVQADAAMSAQTIENASIAFAQHELAIVRLGDPEYEG